MRKFCMFCGAAVNSEDRFCANCGKEIKRGKPEQVSQQSPPPLIKRLSDKKKSIIWGLFILLCVIGIASNRTDEGISVVFGFIAFGFIMAFLWLLFKMFIKAIQKKPIKKTALSFFGCFMGFCVSTAIGMSLDPQLNCEHDYIVTENVNATCMAEGKTIKVCSKCEYKTEDIFQMLEHEWKEADCEYPKICQLCNLSGDSWRRRRRRYRTWTSAKSCSFYGICLLGRVFLPTFVLDEETTMAGIGSCLSGSLQR